MKRDHLLHLALVALIVILVMTAVALFSEGWAAVLASWVFIVMLVSANNRLSAALGRQGRLLAQMEMQLEAMVRLNHVLQARLSQGVTAFSGEGADLEMEVALARLDLDPGMLPDLAALKSARREAILRTHPDGGGSSARVQAVEAAYRALRSRISP